MEYDSTEFALLVVEDLYKLILLAKMFASLSVSFIGVGCVGKRVLFLPDILLIHFHSSVRDECCKMCTPHSNHMPVLITSRLW